MSNTGGRPEYEDKQYEIWLEELKPFLERGKSLYKSMELAALLKHQTTIYEKMRLNDWFSQKVKAYGHALGERINDTFVTLIFKIEEKVKRGEALTDQEARMLMFGAEKHRSAQPFFVNRFETAKGRPVEDIIEGLEAESAKKENIDDVAANIQKELANASNMPQIAPQQAQNQTTLQPENDEPKHPIEIIDPNSIDPNATITA